MKYSLVTNKQAWMELWDSIKPEKRTSSNDPEGWISVDLSKPTCLDELGIPYAIRIFYGADLTLLREIFENQAGHQVLREVIEYNLSDGVKYNPLWIHEVTL